MKFKEAVFKAYAYGKPCAVVNVSEDEYELRKFEMPEGTELVFFGPLPEAMTPAAADKFKSLYSSILYGKNVRLPGKGIIRRGK